TWAGKSVAVLSAAIYVVRGLILLAAVIFDRYKQKAKRIV
ncbi:hypothetical protein, partial [Shigella sonnei]